MHDIWNPWHGCVRISEGCANCYMYTLKSLRAECVRQNVTFAFIETGTVFIKDGKTYRIPDKRLQSDMAHKSGMNFQGKPITYQLCTPLGMPIPSEYLYQPQYDWEEL